MIFAISANDSPFFIDEDSGFSRETTCPPNRCIAVSKEKRVRVLGSKNKVARIFPRQSSHSFFPFARASWYSWARERIVNASSLVIWSASKRCLKESDEDI